MEFNKSLNQESTMELMTRMAQSQPVQEPVEAQAPVQPEPVEAQPQPAEPVQRQSKGVFPSVAALVCPNCGQQKFKIIGTKGAMGKAVLGAGMFGAIGNMVADSRSKENFELVPVKYQCLGCKTKFESLPLTAPDEEVLDAPCTVVFHRLSSAVGMAVSQQVFLNGVKVGNVKNNSDLEFQTFTRTNTIFVTDQYGVAFPGEYTFVAQAGGRQDINYKRKFL